MKKKKTAVLILSGLFVVLLVGAFTVVYLTTFGKREEASETQVTDITSFSAYTEQEEFQGVPAMIVSGAKIGEAVDYGSGNYMIDVNGTTVTDYQAYLETVEAAGFKKHSDNGEDAMEGNVYTAAYTKDNLSLTISQAIKLDKTYISASFDMPLSDHMIYKDSYVKDNIEGAKTKLHLLQLNDNGNSFVIQLKNGHFVVHDGGQEIDGPYLLDFLEELAPEGEKPVIEAWFISHAHGDHYGAMMNIASELNGAKRLCVEGFYFFEPCSKVLATMASDAAGVYNTTLSFKTFRNQEGNQTPIYRPQLGQRYYFCDLSIDVCLTPEQYTLDSYYTADFNDTSIWLMHHIENQRVLIAGDASYTGTQIAMNLYEKDYFDLDVFSVLHHGINVYDYFTDYCKVDTVLYTNWRLGSLYQETPEYLSARIEENAHLQESALESYSHGNGTVVLTFPYKVGTAEIMEASDWRYNRGTPKREIPE